jgi:hyperosmotically inducible periplasmic protein
MKLILRTSLVPALLMVFALTGTALAQSASESMKDAGTSATNAVKHVVNGTATAVSDTALTTKVKTALHGDAGLKGARIHVTTVAGVVTLRGSVRTTEASGRAQDIAQRTEGVKSVTNELTVR